MDGILDGIVDDIRIINASSARLLGVTISDGLRWQAHVDTLTTKAAQKLYVLYHLAQEGIR